MTFPAVESQTNTAFSSGATSHVASLPAAINSGDLLIALWGGKAASGFTVTTPAGWTLINHDDFQGNPAINMWLGYLIADGSEGGGTIDFVTNINATGAVQIIRISGWLGTSEGIEVSTYATAGSGAPNSASLTTSWTSEDTLWISVGAAGDDDVLTTAAPENYIGLSSTISGGGGNNGAEVMSAYRELATDTEDPGAFTLASSEAWGAHTIAIRPSISDGTDSEIAGEVLVFNQSAHATSSLSGLANNFVLPVLQTGKASVQTGGITVNILIPTEQSVNADVPVNSDTSSHVAPVPQEAVGSVKNKSDIRTASTADNLVPINQHGVAAHITPDVDTIISRGAGITQHAFAEAAIIAISSSKLAAVRQNRDVPVHIADYAGFIGAGNSEETDRVGLSLPLQRAQDCRDRSWHRQKKLIRQRPVGKAT